MVVFKRVLKIFFNIKRQAIDCPIIVWNGSSVENITEGILKLLVSLRKKCQCIIVITHADKLNNSSPLEWAEKVNWDPDNVFVVRNYKSEGEWEELCVKDPSSVKANYIQILKILKRSIEIASKNNRNSSDCMIL